MKFFGNMPRTRRSPNTLAGERIAVTTKHVTFYEAVWKGWNHGNRFIGSSTEKMMINFWA